MNHIVYRLLTRRPPRSLCRLLGLHANGHSSDTTNMSDNIGTISKALCFRDPYKAIFKRVPISFPDFWTNTQNQSVEKSPPKAPQPTKPFSIGIRCSFD